jgi:hypothetical protein
MPIIYSNNIFGQPPQAIPTKEKNTEWKEANMNWMEDFFKSQLPLKKKRLGKNYNMAQGVIDINDYIKLADNAYTEMYDKIESEIQESLFQDNESIAEDFHFYPIVPSIINVLMGESLKRFDHTKIKAVDDHSTNEYMEHKKGLITQYIQQKAQAEISKKLEEMGVSQDNPEYAQQSEQAMQQAMSLPEIEKYMGRTYKNTYEDWANRILEQATYKYKLDEKTPESFKHMLTADESYWHVNILDSDLEVDIWNPMETICLKTSHHKYTTHADLIGRQYYTTVANVTAKWKNKIDAAIVERYDTNVGGPSALRDKRRTPDDDKSFMQTEERLQAFKYLFGDDNISNSTRVLVTEGYWVTQRRLGHLSAVYDGTYIEKIVDDTFSVTINPVYDDEKNLIYGEKIEYFYAPQVWKGVKLNFSEGSVAFTAHDEDKYLKDSIFKKGSKGKNKKSNLENGELFIDVQPTEYQFTDALNPFRPKIPVVGCDGFEPGMNVGKLSLVDKTKAWQILFNACMNQIDNFMRTEIGMFYVLDQKLIPKNSLDGSWGQNNYMKFLLTAQETQLGIVDASAANTEGQATMQQPTVIDLLKNQQFQSRIELATTFKNLLFETIGITPQRLGTIGGQETATGVNQAINNSYSQTEPYFFNHSQLMREVKDVILDAEKYIESKKPISRVQYLNSDQENMLFEMETDDLLLRRYNIYLTSNPDSQRVLEQLRQLAIQNNTSGASILDLATIIESNNSRDIKDTLLQSYNNLQKQEQAKMQQEQQMQEQLLASNAEEKQKDREFQADQNEKDRIKDMYIADVRASGFAKDNDINENNIPDPLEVAAFNLEQGKHYQDVISKEQERNIKYKEQLSKTELEKQKLAVEQNKMATQNSMKDKEIKRDYANMKNDEKIARINQQNKNKSK